MEAAQVGVSRLTGGNVLSSTARTEDKHVYTFLEAFEASLWDLYPVLDTSFLQRVSRRREFTSSTEGISVSPSLMQTNTINLKTVEKKNNCGRVKKKKLCYSLCW